MAPVMDAQHDVRRFRFGFVEKLHQHEDDEFHGGVVVVVEDAPVTTSLLDLLLLAGGDLAFAVFSFARVVCHRDQNHSSPAPRGSHSQTGPGRIPVRCLRLGVLGCRN